MVLQEHRRHWGHHDPLPAAAVSRIVVVGIAGGGAGFIDEGHWLLPSSIQMSQERCPFSCEHWVRWRHHAVLGEQLGLELLRPPSDSAFRYFFLQVDVVALCAAIRNWTIAQILGGVAEADLDQLV